MGVLRSTRSFQADVEEMIKMPRGSASGGNDGGGLKMQPASVKRSTGGDKLEGDGKVVCVTGGVSFIGFAHVMNRLLEVGYTIRLTLETQDKPCKTGANKVKHTRHDGCTSFHSTRTSPHLTKQVQCIIWSLVPHIATNHGTPCLQIPPDHFIEHLLSIGE